MDKQEAVMTALRKSMDAVKKVEPILCNMLEEAMDDGSKFKLYAVEGDDNEICKKLDLTCGIDYMLEWIRDGKSTMYGVGCRVQWVDLPKEKLWNTFTIRIHRDSGAETEFEKRVRAINSKAIYPTLTLHIYMNKNTGNVESFAIAKTEEITKYILTQTQGIEHKHTGSNQIGQASFIAVDWKLFEPYAKRLYVYERSSYGNLF